MNSTGLSPFPILLEKLLEGRIDDEPRARLISLLRADPALVDEMSRHLVVSEALARLQPGRDDDAFARHVSERAIRLGQEEGGVFFPRVFRRFPRFAAAVLLVISGVSVFSHQIF